MLGNTTLKLTFGALGCCGSVAVAVLLLYGFFGAELGLFVPLPRGTPCHAFDVSMHPSFVFQKQPLSLSLWHWKYVSDTDGLHGSFAHQCPTWRHETQLTVNDVVVGSTNVSALSGLSVTHVLDCHGDVAFSWDSGRIFATTTTPSSFRVNANYVIMSAAGDAIAYVNDGDTFFENDIDILSAADSSLVANIHGQTCALLPWRWTYTVFNASHPAASVLLLTMLTGQVSFDVGTTDGCNNFFALLIFWLVAVASLLLCMLGCAGSANYRKAFSPQNRRVCV
jgi:hypothetical protein